MRLLEVDSYELVPGTRDECDRRQSVLDWIVAHTDPVFELADELIEAIRIALRRD